MKRRELLQIIGGAATLQALSGLAPRRLLALGESVHESATTNTATSQHLELIAALSERILPETDTPGAIAVGVPAFIEVIVHHWMTDEERERLDKGLAAIDAAANTRFKANFVDLTSDQQNTLIGEWDTARQREPGSAADAYGRIKDMTVYGYFTSKPVVENVLQLRRLPGRYNGCIPV
ncbi:MAG TPA: gluconate 2-dehydrogenase subunit 3 family protein [Gemmatimonadaceae bacterium]|nr:gluconate 2-dehydrogenase subunit 3 family protein [Gemmatimonadaceae bacterium]